MSMLNLDDKAHFVVFVGMVAASSPSMLPDAAAYFREDSMLCFSAGYSAYTSAKENLSSEAVFS
jgi:hypothetical protein